jgi:hypothetical protein
MSVEQRKVPFTGFLEVRQLAEIDRLAKESARPKSEILREALDEYLTARAPATPVDGPGTQANGIAEPAPIPRSIWTR